MTLTMNEALAFYKFYNQVKDLHCSLKTSYKLNKIESSISQEVNFYNQKFAEIVQKYAKRNEQGEFIYSPDGSSIEIVDGKSDECQSEVAELQNLKIDVPDITFSIEEFDGLNISISELRPAMSFIVD